MVLFVLGFAFAAQAARVTMNVSNVKVVQAMKQLKKLTGYTFVYYSKDIDTSKRVSVKATNAEVNDVVAQILTGQNVDYTISGKRIIVSRKAAATAPARAQQPAQQKGTTVKTTGRVTDTNGEPIIGATVRQAGTNNATVTDVDGNFTINALRGAQLEISYVGFNQQVVSSNGGSLNVTMQEGSNLLDDVVVIGYGTVKRVNLGGAVSTADSQVFDSRSVTDATAALQGEVPGLTVIRNGGNVDDGTTLRIRDISSINQGSPLVLIDGAVGNISLINPADIDNISVLKDGTAAIYGARAASGVILVTTKKGKMHQPVKVNFNTNLAVKTPGMVREPQSLYQFAEMALEITDGSFVPEYTRDELELIRQGSDKVEVNSQNYGRWNGYTKFYKDQNWNDMVIGNGNQQNYNINVSGGGDRFNFLVSLGYQHEKGLPKYGKDSDKKYFVRAKASADLLKSLTYDINLSYEAGSRKYSTGLGLEGGPNNIWDFIYKCRRWAPMYTPGGHFYEFEGFVNPAQLLEEGGFSKRTSGNFTFNNQLTWKPLKGLSIVGQAVIRKYDFDKDIDNKIIYAWNWEDVNHMTQRQPNFSKRSYDKTTYRNYTVYGEYKNVFAGKHSLSVMMGASHESENYDSFWAQRMNYDQQENMSLQLGSTQNQSTWSEGYAWTINSYFGRINYMYADKYIIEGTLRTDGSSRFAPGHRWGWFPGVNAAWRINDERFMKHVSFIDDLKIRGSYGKMGNQSGIGYYDYLSLVSISSDYYPFGDGVKGQMASAGTLVSLDRTWETLKVTNIGVDFALLDNQLYGSFDYFWKHNDNMLILVTYPSLLGATAPTTNSGKLRVYGWELTLGWRGKIKDFKYDVSLNISDSKNKVVSRVGSNLITLGLNSTPTGYPINSFFGYDFDGIIQDEAQLQAYKERFHNGGIPGDLTVGDAMYKDLDGDGQLSVLGDGKEGSGDVKYLGDQNPRYNFGFNLRMSWHGFDFSAFVQGVLRRTFFLSDAMSGLCSVPIPAAWWQGDSYWYGKTWTQDRTNAKYPAITLKDKRYYNYRYSTNTKFNAAYARLKNLQVGYTIPQKVLAKWGIQKLRVYFSGENLCEVTGTPKGWDPEEYGTEYAYPFTRTYSVGFDITF